MLVSIYVDGCVIIGNDKAIKNTVTYIKTKFAIKEFDKIDKYLGCDIKFDTNGVTIGQKEIYSNIWKKFHL